MFSGLDLHQGSSTTVPEASENPEMMFTSLDFDPEGTERPPECRHGIQHDAELRMLMAGGLSFDEARHVLFARQIRNFGGVDPSTGLPEDQRAITSVGEPAPPPPQLLQLGPWEVQLTVEIADPTPADSNRAAYMIRLVGFGGKGPQISARRHYTAFRLCHQELAQQFGSLVPAVPPKQPFLTKLALKRATLQRRAALEEWLHKVLSSEELRNSSAVRRLCGVATHSIGMADVKARRIKNGVAEFLLSSEDPQNTVEFRVVVRLRGEDLVLDSMVPTFPQAANARIVIDDMEPDHPYTLQVCAVDAFGVEGACIDVSVSTHAPDPAG